MIKKFFALFSLEERLNKQLQKLLDQASTVVEAKFVEQDKKILESKQFTMSQTAKFNERMSKFEVLFEDEIKAKEAKRDALVLAKMKEHKEQMSK